MKRPSRRDMLAYGIGLLLVGALLCAGRFAAREASAPIPAARPRATVPAAAAVATPEAPGASVPATATGVPTPSPLRFAQPVGEVLTYQFRARYATEARVLGLPVPDDANRAAVTEGEGRLEVRTASREKDAAVLSVRFTDLDLRRTEPGGRPARSDEPLRFEPEIALRRDARGLLHGVRLPDGLPPRVADFLQAVLAQALLVLPDTDTAAWDEAEHDLTGAYRASYRSEPIGRLTEIHKTKKYAAPEPARGRKPGAAALRPMHEGEMVFWFDAESGRLERCRGRETMTVSAMGVDCPVRIVQTQEMEMSLVSRRGTATGALSDATADEAKNLEEVTPAPYAAAHAFGARVDRRRATRRSDGSGEARAEMDEAAIEGSEEAGSPSDPAAPVPVEGTSLTGQVMAEDLLAQSTAEAAEALPLPDLLTRLQSAEAGAAFRATAVETFAALVANFAVDADAVLEAVALAEDPSVRADVRGVLLDALAAAGTAGAEEELTRIASSATATEDARLRAVQALGSVETPAAGTVELLEGLLGAGGRGAEIAAVSLGRIAHRDAGGAQGASIATTLESTLAGGGVNPAAVVTGLGNAAQGSSLPLVLDVTRSTDEETRVAAARALRSYPADADAGAALARMMGEDASASVRESAARSAADHADATSREALAWRIALDPVSRVRHAALDGLVRRMDAEPDARLAVETTALSSPYADLRARATEALGR